MGSPADDAAERVADERRAPEFQAAVGRTFVTDAVDGSHVDAVGHGVRALHQLPGLMLGRAELRFLPWVPANGGRIEKDVGALERGQAGRLRIPLIPAAEGAD